MPVKLERFIRVMTGGLVVSDNLVDVRDGKVIKALGELKAEIDRATDENIGEMLVPTAFGGIKLQVAAKDADRAKEVLAYHARDPESLCEKSDGNRIWKALLTGDGTADPSSLARSSRSVRSILSSTATSTSSTWCAQMTLGASGSASWSS